jgi:hypothetical protein
MDGSVLSPRLSSVIPSSSLSLSLYFFLIATIAHGTKFGMTITTKMIGRFATGAHKGDPE